MKIYYDSCQTYGGSENNTRFFDAAYNKPRLSARSARAEPPAGGVLLRSGRTYPPNHLSITLSALLASSSPAMTLGADTGRSAPADVSKDPRHPSGPSQVHAAVFPPFVAPQIQLSVPSDPRHPLHNINMQLLGFFFFLFCF